MNCEIRLLKELMEAHPNLSDFGMGVYDYRYKKPDQIKEELKFGRERLMRYSDAVFEIQDWLEKYITPIKSINRRYTSYTMKHWVERRIERGYVTNGQFIAAALLAGFTPLFDWRGGPNVQFNMSEKSWKIAKANQPPRGGLEG